MTVQLCSHGSEYLRLATKFLDIVIQVWPGETVILSVLYIVVICIAVFVWYDHVR